jgi:cytochrome oxidase Cu insertion factor (SCO1/SenC/PrrC family)
VSRRRLLPLLAFAAVAAAVATVLLAARDDSGGERTAPASDRYRGSVVPAGIRLAEFALHDEHGRPVSARALRGKVVVLTFIDTDCKESCPIIAGVIGAAVPRLSPAEQQRVAAIAITVNPTADSPARVRRFLREHRALGKLRFLRGSLPQLEHVWRAFDVLSAVRSGDPNVHSAPVRIYDRAGLWVSTLHAGADLNAANLIHDVREALRD